MEQFLALENQTAGIITNAQLQTQAHTPMPRAATPLATNAETCLTDINKNNSKIMADKRFKINLIIILHLITLIVASFEIFKIYDWNNRMNLLQESQSSNTITVQDQNQNQNPVFHLNKIFLNCSIPNNKENVYIASNGQFNGINMDIHVDLRIRPSPYYAFSILLFTSLVAILAGIFVLCQNMLPQSCAGAPLTAPSPAPFSNQSENGNLNHSPPPEMQVTVEQEQELQRPRLRLRNEQSKKGSASVCCYIFLGLVAHVFNCMHLASIISGLNNANDSLQGQGQGQILSQGQGHLQANQLCTYAAMPITTPLPSKEQELVELYLQFYNCFLRMGINICPNYRYLIIYLGIMVLELLLILPSLLMPWLKLLGTMFDTNNGHDPGTVRDEDFLSLPLPRRPSHMEVDSGSGPEDHMARTATQKLKAKEAQILLIAKQQSITLSLLQRVNAALQNNNNVRNPNQLNEVVRNEIDSNNNRT